MKTEVEIQKVDAQGRLTLPADWRKTELSEITEVYVIKRKGYLKVIPKHPIDLTEHFDQVDLDIDSIGDWSQFEKLFNEAKTQAF